jgi:Ca2+-binding EF-hand superfamily protein
MGQVQLASQASSGEAWRLLLQQFDRDNDGLIGVDEFIAAGKQPA